MLLDILVIVYLICEFQVILLSITIMHPLYNNTLYDLDCFLSIGVTVAEYHHFTFTQI